VTSTSWSQMDVFFVNEIRHSIYAAKVNGLIPWACIQRPSLWVGGDPNPATAFRVEDGGLEQAGGGFHVEPGYYFYQQVCRAGQPGMAVCRVMSNDSEVGLIGFAGHGPANPNAFVVLNLSGQCKELDMEVLGSAGSAFRAYRTSSGEEHASLGDFALSEGRIAYLAPAGSVTTFHERPL